MVDLTGLDPTIRRAVELAHNNGRNQHDVSLIVHTIGGERVRAIVRFPSPSRGRDHISIVTTDAAGVTREAVFNSAAIAFVELGAV